MYKRFKRVASGSEIAIVASAIWGVTEFNHDFVRVEQTSVRVRADQSTDVLRRILSNENGEGFVV